jgi:hypothetical protein
MKREASFLCEIWDRNFSIPWWASVCLGLVCWSIKARERILSGNVRFGWKSYDSDMAWVCICFIDLGLELLPVISTTLNWLWLNWGMLLMMLVYKHLLSSESYFMIRLFLSVRPSVCLSVCLSVWSITHDPFDLGWPNLVHMTLGTYERLSSKMGSNGHDLRRQRSNVFFDRRGGSLGQNNFFLNIA